MQKLSFLLIFFFNLFIVSGQDEISWSVKVSEKHDEVIIRADLSEGWHLYSRRNKMDFGPFPVSFEFEKNANIELVGEVVEPEPIVVNDENFKSEMAMFSGSPEFIQKIKVLNSGTVQLTVSYMICNDRQCLPLRDEVFTIQLLK